MKARNSRRYDPLAIIRYHHIHSNPHLPVPLHLSKVHVSQSRQYYSRNKENGWIAEVKVRYLENKTE